ncbi:alpha/beta fold hydrolase [Methylohalobius crimeensis]|uniref:alpha/beta fold hydrolase n=1 Tax=Methylohalobius crimeensis TaxID=244365 RepID=UPI0003B7948D|nr:alpha/beta hydrolase [Methylohalobius crimeensis]
MIEDAVLTTSRGRRIAFARYGDPDGRPIGYCHGLPSSRLEAALVASTAKRMKLHLFAADRPGYGRSDPLPPTRIADWPKDLARVADHLGIDRFAVLGVSGGGPYALACGQYLGSRIDRIGLVCPLGPVAQTSLRQSMSPAARWAFFLASKAPWALPIFFGKPTAYLIHRYPDLAFSLLMRSLPDKDREVLASPEIREVFRATIREGLCHGSAGTLRDFLHYIRPWGVELASVDLRVTFWHGDVDTVVPLAHSRHLAERLPRAKLHILPGEGHYSLPVNYAETILGDFPR